MDTNDVMEYVRTHPAGRVKIALADVDGVLRGKYLSTEKFLAVADSGLGFCDVVFGWDNADALYDNVTYTGWHTGFPDARARIDLASFRRIPEENNTPFFLAGLTGGNQGPCPRSLLE